MKRLPVFLVFFVSLSGFGQHAFVDPPEMRGQAKELPPTSAADLAFYDALKANVGSSFDPATVPLLNRVIRDYPDYANAYAWRANVEMCGEKPLDLQKAKVDLQTALSKQEESSPSLFSKQDIYSLLAKLEFADGKYSAAIDLLEKAMMVDLRSADKIFNIQGTKPETTSSFCGWNLTELRELGSHASKDWRPTAFEGLYFEFFTTFSEEFYPQSTALLQKASLLNPTTPVVPYLQGELKNKSAFWTKKAWSSNSAKNDLYRAAVRFFSRAILLRRSFGPAYAARAEAYLESRQDALAIRDYDEVISMNPNDASAHADRGLAHFNLAQYYAAISDYSDAYVSKITTSLMHTRTEEMHI